MYWMTLVLQIRLTIIINPVSYISMTFNGFWQAEHIPI